MCACKPLRACSQPDPPVALTGTSGSIATLAWQVAAKENQLEKVQDELHQVRLRSVWGSGAAPAMGCA
jgi:hypothetical protein